MLTDILKYYNKILTFFFFLLLFIFSKLFYKKKSSQTADIQPRIAKQTRKQKNESRKDEVH